MAADTRIAKMSRARFMQAVNEELANFERSESEFSKRDRDERAKRLQMPVEKYDAGDWRVAKASNPVRKV